MCSVTVILDFCLICGGWLLQEAATSTQSASSDSSSNEEKMMITISTSEADELIIADPLDS